MLRSRYMHGCLSRNTLCSSQGTLCFAPGRHAVSQGTLCASLWYMAVSQGTLYAAHCLSKYTCELVSLMAHFYKPLKNSTRTRSLCFSRHASYTAKKVSFLLWFVLCWTVHFAVPGSHRLTVENLQAPPTEVWSKFAGGPTEVWSKFRLLARCNNFTKS